MNAPSNAARLRDVATAPASEEEERERIANMRPKEKVAYMLKKKEGELMAMLPKHLPPERLMKVAQIAATTTPQLAECDVASLVGAIGQCAQMGLEPNTVLGHAYLVPFTMKRKDAEGKERWVKSVQVIVGYKGLIDLARRSGQIISIAAHEVCENDKFTLAYGLEERLDHVPALKNRGEVIGYYAVAKLVGGGHAFEWMSLEQVNRIRDGSQAAYKDEWEDGRKTGRRVPKAGPWWDNPVEMGRKTVIRRLAKYLPLSIEMQTAVQLDELAARGKDQALNTFDGEFTSMPTGDDDADGAPADDEAPPPAALTDERAAQQAAQVPQQTQAAEPEPVAQQQAPAEAQKATPRARVQRPAPPPADVSLD